MATIVTGLLQGTDLSTLRAAIRDAGHDPDSLQVLSPDDAQESSSSHFVGRDMLGDHGSTGTGVPGITSSQNRREYFRNDSITDRLGDFEIPDSEVDNYVEAIERGRSVVAYFAKPATVDAVEAAFRGANLSNVRRF